MAVGNGLSLELYFLIVGANILIDSGYLKYRFSQIRWDELLPLAILANVCAWGFLFWLLMTAEQDNSDGGIFYAIIFIKFIIYGWPLSRLYPKIDNEKVYSTVGTALVGGAIAALLIEKVFG